MSTHERILAERQMEHAMIFADRTVRAWNRIRGVLAGTGKVLKDLGAAFMWKRDYVKNGVVHYD